VNSKRGTQFRIWARGVLKDYLVKGYSLNARKLRERERSIEEVRDMVMIVADFSRGLRILDDYDRGTLDEGGATTRSA
jgi:hypothetical protein